MVACHFDHAQGVGCPFAELVAWIRESSHLCDNRLGQRPVEEAACYVEQELLNLSLVITLVQRFSQQEPATSRVKGVEY